MTFVRLKSRGRLTDPGVGSSALSGCRGRGLGEGFDLPEREARALRYLVQCILSPLEELHREVILILFSSCFCCRFRCFSALFRKIAAHMFLSLLFLFQKLNPRGQTREIHLVRVGAPQVMDQLPKLRPVILRGPEVKGTAGQSKVGNCCIIKESKNLCKEEF